MADPHFGFVTLLAHCDGTDGSTTFVDSSSYARALTPQAGVSISTAQSKFGGASAFLDNSTVSGSGQITAAASADFDLTGDFTIEFWARKTANNPSGYDYAMATCANSSGAGGWYIALYDGTDGFTFGSGASALATHTPTTVTDGVWHHYAACRVGTNLRLFVDGVQVAINTGVSGALAGDYDLRIGSLTAGNAQGRFYGYIDDVRITNGVGRYAANFTPPTAAFPDSGVVEDPHYVKVSLLLHGDGTDGSTTITDTGPLALTPLDAGTVTVSTVQAKFAQSLRFTGVGNQLRYANNAAFNPGAGSFTAEAFVRLDALSGTQTILSNYATASTGMTLVVLSTGAVAANLSGDVYDLQSAAGVVSAATWHHIALSGQQGSYKLFVDGAVVATFNGTVSIDSAADLTIGGLLYSSTWYDRLTGYLDEVRVTKGVARYTDNFTPPTVAFGDSGPALVISGTVRDDTGALCARTVRMYLRSTGALEQSATSDATTGVYTFGVSNTAQRYVVVLDDDAGVSHNALIADKLVGA